MGIRPYTKDEYLELWRQVLPKFYTDPIEAEGDGRGFDIPSLQAAIFERFERAANITQQAYFLRPHSIQTEEIARGAAKARGSVLVSRLSAALGSLIIPAGTPFEAEQIDSYGQAVSLGIYRSLSDVTLASGALGPVSVTVEASYPGHSGNLEFPGQIVRFAPLGRATVKVVALSSSLIARSVGVTEESNWDVFTAQHRLRYLRLVQLDQPLVSTSEPRRVVSFEDAGIRVFPSLSSADIGKTFQVEIEEWADLGLTVAQPQPITGGRSDSIGAVATDRNVGRAPGETDDQLADRLVYLEDTISPAAIERTVGAILDPYGIGWCLKEASDVDTLIGFIWDVHPFDFGGLQRVEKLPGSELIGQGAVWLSAETTRRFFIICVDRSGLGDFGFGFDVTLSAMTNAWDVGAYDGKPVGWWTAVGRVWEAVNSARAAGVGFQVLTDCC